jgi:hypothetical protein
VAGKKGCLVVQEVVYHSGVLGPCLLLVFVSLKLLRSPVAFLPALLLLGTSESLSNATPTVNASSRLVFIGTRRTITQSGSLTLASHLLPGSLVSLEGK